MGPELELVLRGFLDRPSPMRWLEEQELGVLSPHSWQGGFRVKGPFGIS